MMCHCLYAYRIVGDNAYGLSKLVSVVATLYCVPFSLVLFGCLRPNGKGVIFGEEIKIFWN